MTAVVEIGERVTEGIPWAVSWPNGRSDSGYSRSYEHACIAVGDALWRENVSREIHAFYDAHSHTNCGD